MKEELDGYLTEEEAASLLGVTTTRRVRQLCLEGKLPGAFLPRPGWRIPQEAIGLCGRRVYRRKAAAENGEGD